MSKLLFRLRPAAQGNPATKLTVETQPQAAPVNGAPFSPQPTVQVRRADNSTVAQAGIVVTAALATGAGVLSGVLTAVTDSNGLAAFNNLTITGLVGARTLSFSASGLTPATSAALNLVAGPATQITANSSQSQSATVSTNVGAPPSVLVRDQSLNPVAGVSVAFAVTAGAGTRNPASVATNASGIATLSTWTVGPTVGTNNNVLTATVAGLTGSPVTFTASGVAAGAAVVNYLGFINSTLLGNSREVWIYLPAGYSVGTQRYPVLFFHDGQDVFGSGNAYFMENRLAAISAAQMRPTIIVAVAGKVNALQRDAEYRIVPPAQGQLYARMLVEEMVPYIDANYRTIAAAYARGTGGASLGAVLAWYTAFNYPNTFGICVSQSGTFRTTQGFYDHIADALDQPGKLPFRFYWDRGDSESGGSTFHVDNDQDMRTALLAKGMVEGVDFKYVLAAGAVHDWAAWSQRIDDFMTFVYAPPMAASQISAHTALVQSAVVGTNVAMAPAVLVRDQWRNPIAGVTVTFAVTGGGGTRAPGTVVTDANGIATLGSWTLGPIIAAGNNTLTATVAGLAGSPVTFVASGVAASAGVIDGLGVLRDGMDPTHTMIIGRQFGSVEFDGGSSGQGMHGGALLSPFLPFRVKYTEGYDEQGESGTIRRVRDKSAPMQQAREALYRNIGVSDRGDSVAFYGLWPGAAGQQAWAQTATFPTTATNRWSVNQQWWELDWERVFKFLPDYPDHLLNKFGFIGISGINNMCMMAFTTPNTGSMTAQLGNLRQLLQGTIDNNLGGVPPGPTIAPGARGGAINFSVNPTAGGAILMQDIVGGIQTFFQRGRYYKIREHWRMSTHDPVDRLAAKDGWFKITVWPLISSGQGIVPDVWGAPVEVSGPVGATGLNLERSESAPGVPYNQQSYFTSVQDTFQNQNQFPGNTRFARVGDHAFQTTVAVPFQINGINDDTLPAGSVCVVTPAPVVPANQWAGAMVVCDAARNLSLKWAVGTFATAALAEAAIPYNPPNNKTEIGYLTIQAGPLGWIAATDALTGGTAGNPAAVTNYWNRSGVLMASHFLQMKAS